jgi:hypothetical protein
VTRVNNPAPRLRRGSTVLPLTLAGLTFTLIFMATGGTPSDATAQGDAPHPGPLPGFSEPHPPPPPYVPAGPFVQRPRRVGVLLAALGIVVAIAFATAALVVSLISAHRNANPAQVAQTQGQGSNQPASTTQADRALCEAIAPLIKESNADAKAYTTIANGTSERDAATPGFVSQTSDWVKRAQPVLDQYSTPPRYLTRTLQRYIDDMRLLASSLRPGPSTEADRTAWNDSLVALGGPYEVCGDLGVPLW